MVTVPQVSSSMTKSDTHLQWTLDTVETLEHELRTPLTVLLGYLELLANEESVPPEQRRMFTAMLRNARQLHNAVERLILFHALSVQRLNFYKAPVNLVSLIRERAIQWREEIRRAGFRFELQLEVPMAYTLGDARFLQIALDILVENAIKFSRTARWPTSPKKRRGIRVRVWETVEEVRVSVEDQGVGIAPRVLERIFEPFFQADRSLTRVHGGLGIGLALCRAVIEAHGGRVWAESDGPGLGSVFHIALPRMRPQRAMIKRRT